MQALREELGDDKVIESPPLMGSEGFGHLAAAIDVPGMFWFFGGAAKDDENPAKTIHPDFYQSTSQRWKLGCAQLSLLLQATLVKTNAL